LKHLIEVFTSSADHTTATAPEHRVFFTSKKYALKH
jgi:hypothetical protein